MSRFSLGFDFGTESVRVIAADVSNGRPAAQATAGYAVLDEALPDGTPLPKDFALQNPAEWMDAATSACRQVVGAGGLLPSQVIGLGVAFTSCTMLPCLSDGRPLCQAGYVDRPLAWPRLWKHHGAKAETDRLNAVARERREPWLARYGGSIGLEWLFPKILETFNHDREAYDAADLWLEAGDWFVWQLVGGLAPETRPAALVRSTCQAGYKAMWNAEHGYPSEAFLEAVAAGFGGVLQKLSGTLRAPGERAGLLSESAAARFGLQSGTPVSAAIIDAHAGVPGAGVDGAGTLVMVMGTSSCQMLNSPCDHPVAGVAGVVRHGILPGYYGYETGQSSVGDAFAWLAESSGQSHESLTQQAAALPPGAGGVLAIDWFNGCRTPLMDGRLSGAFLGLTPLAQMYRALLEATAFGVRWIVETLRNGNVTVDRVVASGGLPGRSPLLMQIYADVLNEPITLAESDQSVAQGAAILGALAGDNIIGADAVGRTIRAMARQRPEPIYRPNSGVRAE